MKKYLFSAIVILVLVSASLYGRLQHYKDEAQRLEGNQQALMERAEYYQAESGKYAASVQKLELTKAELERNYDEICKAADDLRIKVKRIESASQTATETRVEVQAVVRDSIIYRNETGSLDTLKLFQWRDPWVYVDGQIRKDSVDLNVCSADTLIQIVHRVPKKFLFFRWGTKAIRQEIYSTNPHTRITYTEYMEIK